MNAHLPFVKKVATSFVKKVAVSRILTKLRCVEKQSVSSSSSTEPVSLLGDAGASHFFISETIILERVSDLCFLFKFLT
jgi:hypothetical protein